MAEDSIKYSEIVVNDGAFEKLYEAIELAEKKIAALHKSVRTQATATQKVIQKLNSTDTDYNQTLQEVEKHLDSLAKEYAKVKAQEADLNKQKIDSIKLSKAQEELKAKELQAKQQELKLKQQESVLRQRLLKEEQEQQKSTKKTLTAYQQASRNLTELRNRYKDLAVTNQENTKEAKALLSQVQALDKKLKDIDATVGQFNRTVGNYKESIKEAAEETGLWGASLANSIDQTGLLSETVGKLTAVLDILKKQFFFTTQEAIANTAATEANAVAQTAAAAGASRFTKAFKILNSVLKASVIGLIVVALGAIVSLFTRTASGIEKAEVFMEAFADVLGVVLQRLAVVGGGLIKVFGGIFDAFKLMGLKLQLLGLQIKEAFTFGEAAKVLQKEIATIKSEIDSLKPGEEVSQGITEIANSFDGVGESIEKAIEAAERFVALRTQLRKLNNELENDIAKLTALENEQTQIANDATLSFKRRRRAAEEASAAELKAAQDRVQIAENQLKIEEAAVRKQLELRQGADKILRQDEIEAIDEKKRAVIAAESELQVKRQEFATQQRELAIDALDNQLDVLQDGLKAQEAVTLKEAANEKLAFDTRRRILEENAKLAEVSFNRQAELIQELSKKQIDFNDLVAEKDAEVLAAKIKGLELGDKMEKLLLKTIKERVGVIQSEKEAIAEVTKVQIAATEKLVKDYQDQTVEFIQNDMLRALAAEDLATKRRVHELEEQKKLFAGNLEAQKAFDELILNQYQQSEDRKRQIRLKGFEENLALEEKQLELSLLRQGKSQEEIDKAIRDNKIESVEEEIEYIKQLEAEARANGLKEDVQLTKERIDKELELERLKLAKQKAIQKELNRVRDLAANKIFDVLDRELKEEEEVLNKKLDLQENQIEKQQELAAQGAANTLAFEEAQQAKLLAEQQKNAKKQIQLEKIKALYAAYSNAASSGDKNALVAAFKDIAILTAVEATLTQFGEGGDLSEILDANGNGANSRGSIQNGFIRGEKHKTRGRGIPVLVEGNEGILSGKEMNNLGRGNFHALKGFLGGKKLGGDFMAEQAQGLPGVALLSVDLAPLQNEMKGVKKAVENIPSQKIDVVQWTKSIADIVDERRQGRSVVRNIYRVNKKRLG